MTGKRYRGAEVKERCMLRLVSAVRHWFGEGLLIADPEIVWVANRPTVALRRDGVARPCIHSMRQRLPKYGPIKI